jgi:hypothetical protein
MNLRIRAHAIPGFDANLVRVHGVRCERGQSVDLSVDLASMARGPLIRGEGRAYLLRREGSKVRRITTQAEQRQGFLPAIGADSHLARWQREHPQRKARFVTGQGNLGINSGVLALTTTGALGARGFWNGALHVHADGRLTRPAEWPVTEGFVLTGPNLVRDGKALPLVAEAFADPRHVLRFAWVQTVTGERVDFGHDELFADRGRLAAALAGVPQEFPLEVQVPVNDDAESPLRQVAVEKAVLRRDLEWKGYRECAEPSLPGEFHFLDGWVRMVFLPGLYPHHVLAVGEDGRLCDIVISGLSNRAGVVVAELAEDLAAAGYVEALLLDNGGDVGLFDVADNAWRVQPAEPDRSESWPLTAALIHHEAAS